MPREKCCFAGIKYPLNPVPLLSINYTVVRNETEDGVEGEGKTRKEGKKEEGGKKKEETKRVRNERRRSGGNTILRLAVFHENLRPR